MGHDGGLYVVLQARSDGGRSGMLCFNLEVTWRSSVTVAPSHRARDRMPARLAPCIAPERPFLPQSREDMRLYADLLRADFETYIAEVQTYFRCLDEERARAFVEAREVVEQYGQFQHALE